MTNGVPIRAFLSSVCLASLLACLTPAFGQDPSHTAQQMRAPSSPSSYRPPSNTPIVLLSSDEDYRIGSSDVIEIRIEDAPELSGNFRVAANGTIPMPFLGKLAVKDKTTEELSKLIANGLRGQYLKDPRVSVAVLQYNSRSFFIQGAVRQPGVYQIEGKPSLLKLITIAGGLGEDHGSTAFIIREIKSKTGVGKLGSDGEEQAGGAGAATLAPAASRGTATVSAGPSQPRGPEETGESLAKADETASEAQYEMHKVNINGLLKGNFAGNYLIEPGDIINIPPTDVFFVAGEVRSPGSYPLKDGTTLRQAVSLAQGLTFKAAGKHCVIFREDQRTGNRQEIKIDVGEVMSGKAPDVPILANDIIIVPNSRFKSVGSTLLTAFGVNSARYPMY